MITRAVLHMLVQASSSLDDLRERVVFVGGAVAGLLVVDPAAPAPRPTLDVDLVADTFSFADEVAFADRLRELGFAEDTREGAPRWRWIVNGLTVDIMSPATGPANQWYRHAIDNAVPIALTTATSIRVVSPALFLAMKLDAFADRGRQDAASSHDIEDVIAVVDGRPTIVDDVRTAPAAIRDYVGERLRLFLADPDFADAVSGHLPGDEASQARAPLVLARLGALASGK